MNNSDNTSSALESQAVATVAVFRSKFTPGGEPGRGTPTDLQEALRTCYASDAHLAQYASDERTNRGGAKAMTAVVFDLDGPKHEATEAWLTKTGPAIRGAVETYGGHAYRTRGGWRLVYSLAQPVAVLTETDRQGWSAWYLAQCDLLEGLTGLVPDRSCADPERMFRLPRVRRDGVPTETESYFEERGRVSPWICLVDLSRGSPANDDQPQTATPSTPSDVETLLREPSEGDLAKAVEWLDAQPPAVQGDPDESGHTTLLRVAIALVCRGLDLATVRTLLERYNERCEPPWALDDPKEAADFWRKLDQAMQSETVAQWAHETRAARALFDPKSEPKQDLALQTRATREGGLVVLATHENLLQILTHHPEWMGRLAYDDLSKRVVEPSQGAWLDHHTTELAAWLDRTYRLDAPVERIDRAVVAVARRNIQHPIRNYLEGLRWDSIERIDRLWSGYFGAEDSPLMRAFGRRWMIGAVARVLRPGCKLDTMPIVAGPQGIGKSTGFRALCPEPDWFSDTPLPVDNPTRCAEMMAGVWLYEISELESFRGKEAEAIKGFLSSQQDRVRVSYARYAETFPRQACFVGTTNQETYLKDSTGGRRFWPVTAGQVDLGGLVRDRDCLWAEAVSRFQAKEPWWLNETEATEAADAQDAVREVHPWQEPIARWLNEREAEGFTLAEVASDVLGRSVGSLTSTDQSQIGGCLRALGYRVTRRREGTQTMRVWVR